MLCWQNLYLITRLCLFIVLDVFYENVYFLRASFVTLLHDRYGRAKLALQKGEENLAREALKRRKDYEV